MMFGFKSKTKRIEDLIDGLGFYACWASTPPQEGIYNPTGFLDCAPRVLELCSEIESQLMPELRKDNLPDDERAMLERLKLRTEQTRNVVKRQLQHLETNVFGGNNATN